MVDDAFIQMLSCDQNLKVFFLLYSLLLNLPGSQLALLTRLHSLSVVTEIPRLPRLALSNDGQFLWTVQYDFFLCS